MSEGVTTSVEGLLVLDDRVVGGRVEIADGSIVVVAIDDRLEAGAPYVAPGFVDVHVHGWGGHDAMGDATALDGMARALSRRGVTSFLPTAVSAPLAELVDFAARVRAWIPDATTDGAEPLGANLEGPFLAAGRHGAHDPGALLVPSEVPTAALVPLLDGLRLITIAPELPGALELISWFAERGVAVSLGHSAATLEEAAAAYRAGARSTTHLFNAMSGIDHRTPGLAAAALLDDTAWLELIADGIHVHPSLWTLVDRLRPERMLLVSDAIALAGMGDGQGRIGDLAVDVRGQRVTLTGTSTLAGSVLSLDVAVRNAVGAGIPLPAAVAAASRRPLAMLGITDRGRIAVGQRADLVELDADLAVRRVMRAGSWMPR